MKITLINGDSSIELVAGEMMMVSLTLFSSIRIKCNEPLLKVKYNNQELSWPEGSVEWTIPCLFDQQGFAELNLTTSDERTERYLLRQPTETIIDEKLLLTFADFHRRLLQVCEQTELSMTRLIRAIQSGDLLLLERNDPFSGVSEYSLLDIIEAYIPFIQNVCARPRRHLRVVQEVREIEIVKRISPSSLRHLAAHSEHWKVRTMTELIPARIQAEVVEDELNIYENRFVRTLMDRISKKLLRKRMEIEGYSAALEDVINWQQYSQQFNDYQGGKVLEQLLPDYDNETEELKLLEFSDLLTKVIKLQKQLSSCMSGGFYQKLRKSKKLQLPVIPTNILRLDPNYHRLYQLWEIMNQHDNQHNQEDVSNAFPQDMPTVYTEYCAVLLLYSFYSTGYTIIDEKVGTQVGDFVFVHVALEDEINQVQIRVIRNDEHNPIIEIEIREKLDEGFILPFEVNFTDWGVHSEYCSIRNNHLIFFRKPTREEMQSLARHFAANQERLKSLDQTHQQELKARSKEWQQFINQIYPQIPEVSLRKIVLIPILANIGKNPTDVKMYTEKLLNGAGSFLEENKDIRSVLLLTPIQLRDISGPLDPYLARRLFSYGEAYKCEDALRWGNYRIGMLPISPRQINSIQRYLRALTIHTVSERIQNKKAFQKCVVCNHDSLKFEQGIYSCYSCGGVWGMTSCAHLDCRHEFPWVRPVLLVPKQIEEVRTEQDRLERLENLGGSIVITGFEYCYGETIKNPVCPKCGRTSRDASVSLKNIEVS